MTQVLFVVLTFVISAGIGWFSIPRVVIIAKIKRLFDTPDARKVHTGSVPRLGGLTFFPAMLFSFAFVLGLRYYLGYSVVRDLQTELVMELLFVVAGMLILYFVGMTDDLIGVSYKSKFLAQIIAAGCLVLGGITVTDLQGLLTIHELPFLVDVILTVIVVVLTVNAFNLIDGVDGLCSGLGTIILTCFGLYYIWIELYVYAMFAFGMAGVLIAFFQYNVLGTRLKVFMGDTGSLTLGYVIIFLGLKFMNLENEVPPIMTGWHSTLAMLVGLLFVPIFDTCRVFLSRVSRGKSPFYPDKNHIHHKVLKLGRSHLQSTVILLLLQVGFSLLNVVLSEVVDMGVNWIVLTDIVLGVGINVGLNIAIRKYGRPVPDNGPDRHSILEDN